MELGAALEVLGLAEDATPADVESTYRGLRKPILKELNKHAQGEEPPELIERLDTLETAFKIVTQSSVPKQADVSASQTGTGAATGRTSSRVAFVEGDVVLERYEIGPLLSIRPEGDTYRATDLVRGEPVGLKVLAPELLADPKQRARLKRSLLSATYLNHPHIVRVLGVLELPRTYAVVMQLPEGSESLWERMYGARAKEAPLSMEQVLRLTRQAIHALAYVHTLSPHATLRPESIWIDAAGNAKVADVGFTDIQGALRARRQSRTKLGTAYWAPEQYRAELAVGDPSDQYGLALIVYEILSGKPSVGRTASIRGFRKDYPQRFTQALERALSSKASRRFPTMDAFGEAAFGDYAPERAAPAAVSRESLFLPALVLLGVFAGFVLSPLGQGAARGIASAVERWQGVQALEARSDLELRQLRGMSRRLGARQEALDETSRAELERVRKRLADVATPASERPALRSALTSIVAQLVATSRRRAQEAFEARAAEVDALETSGRAKVRAALDGAQQALPGLDAAADEDRRKAMTRYVRQRAAAERGEVLWRTQMATVLALPAFETAYRGLLEAEAALAIGDETAAEGAYERVASALEGAKADVARAADPFGAFDPLARPAGIAVRVESEEAQSLFDALVEGAGDLSDDADLARVLGTARADAKGAARARLLVHDDGYWTLALEVGVRTLDFAGTWGGAGPMRRLALHVAGGGVLEQPRFIAATRGEGRPGVSDVRALLAAAPRSARSVWNTRSADGEELPKPAFASTGMIVRSGKRSVAGTLEGAEGTAAVVEGRRFEVGEQGFDASAAVSGDVLVTWLRAHALRGLQTGPGALLRVQVDGIEPRVHLLEPAEGTALVAGSDVLVRVLVYDSTLSTLEVGGEAQVLRRDEVYKLIETTLRAPAVGKLTLPIRAADEAGNETVRELSWDVR